MDETIFVTSRRWSFLCPKIVVRVTLSVTFRVTKKRLQKRNVLVSVTVRVTLLTLKKADLRGKRVKIRLKTAILERIRGAKYRILQDSRGTFQVKVLVYNDLREKT